MFNSPRWLVSTILDNLDIEHPLSLLAVLLDNTHCMCIFQMPHRFFVKMPYISNILMGKLFLKRKIILQQPNQMYILIIKRICFQCLAKLVTINNLVLKHQLGDLQEKSGIHVLYFYTWQLHFNFKAFCCTEWCSVKV